MAEDETAAARFVAHELLSRDWTQADLAKAAGVNKNTITAFMKGSASDKTAVKVEAALSLAPGALAALGEETLQPQPEADSASKLSDEELVAELSYRLVRLQRETAEKDARITELEQRLADAGDSDVVEALPPGQVPSWAKDEAANTSTEPKGAAFGNQDQE